MDVTFASNLIYLGGRGEIIHPPIRDARANDADRSIQNNPPLLPYRAAEVIVVVQALLSGYYYPPSPRRSHFVGPLLLDMWSYDRLLLWRC